MRLVTGDAALDCSCLPLPTRINARITDATVGRALLNVQEEHKVEWQAYTLQTVWEAIGVKSCIAAGDDQYVEELLEDYIGYKTQTIAKMITLLQTWFVITKKEKIDTKALFYAPLSETPNTHITTFAQQLDRRQVKCAKNQVTISDSDKVDHFVAQMYLCEIFESKFLNDWEEALDKTWSNASARC